MIRHITLKCIFSLYFTPSCKVKLFSFRAFRSPAKRQTVILLKVMSHETVGKEAASCSRDLSANVLLFFRFWLPAEPGRRFRTCIIICGSMRSCLEGGWGGKHLEMWKQRERCSHFLIILYVNFTEQQCWVFSNGGKESRRKRRDKGRGGINSRQQSYEEVKSTA